MPVLCEICTFAPRAPNRCRGPTRGRSSDQQHPRFSSLFAPSRCWTGHMVGGDLGWRDCVKCGGSLSPGCSESPATNSGRPGDLSGCRPAAAATTKNDQPMGAGCVCSSMKAEIFVAMRSVLSYSQNFDLSLGVELFYGVLQTLEQA